MKRAVSAASNLPGISHDGASSAGSSGRRKRRRNVPATIRIVIADDHAVVRQAITRLLEAQCGMAVVGQASNGVEAVEMVENLHPDVAVIDFAMPEMDGAEATRRIKMRSRKTRVVGLSVFDDPYVAQRMLRAGADRYLRKDQGNQQLISAVCGKSEKA